MTDLLLTTEEIAALALLLRDVERAFYGDLEISKKLKATRSIGKSRLALKAARGEA